MNPIQHHFIIVVYIFFNIKLQILIFELEGILSILEGPVNWGINQLVTGFGAQILFFQRYVRTHPLYTLSWFEGHI